MSHRGSTGLTSSLTSLSSRRVSEDRAVVIQSIAESVIKVLALSYPKAEVRWSYSKSGLEIEVFSSSEVTHVAILVTQHLRSLRTVKNVKVSDDVVNTRIFNVLLNDRDRQQNTSSLVGTKGSVNQTGVSGGWDDNSSSTLQQDLARTKSSLIWKAVFVLSFTGLVFALVSG
jgi:hypothetical protein